MHLNKHEEQHFVGAAGCSKRVSQFTPFWSGVGEAPRPTLAVRPYLNKTNATSGTLAIFKVHRE
ncbi:hypothetical protein AN944_01143 [Shewanella sp. P1-14-1]|nr:hypothetical protein AN944_01143 [Shewanella sp. P1-14-1]